MLRCPLNGIGWLEQTVTLTEIATWLANDISQGFSYGVCIASDFALKDYCKADSQGANFGGSHKISYQSLLLSTNVLNDTEKNVLLIPLANLYCRDQSLLLF